MMIVEIQADNLSDMSLRMLLLCQSIQCAALCSTLHLCPVVMKLHNWTVSLNGVMNPSQHSAETSSQMSASGCHKRNVKQSSELHFVAEIPQLVLRLAVGWMAKVLEFESW
jgi:hypothetical protein